MALLTLTNYRRKGINAYLCPLDGGFAEMIFGEASTPEGKTKAYQGKSHEISIDLGKIPDGYYCYKEAQGHKTRYGWLRIESGEVTEEWASLQDCHKAIVKATETQEENPLAALPRLDGTERQIAWAEKIRDKALMDAVKHHQSLSADDVFESKKSKAELVVIFSKFLKASWWIDRRDEFKNFKAWQNYV